MSLAIGYAIGGSTVRGGATHRDPQNASVLESLVEGAEALGGPGGLGSTPTDGDNGGTAHVVVDGGGDGVEEALVGVGGKIDGDVDAGSDGSLPRT